MFTLKALRELAALEVALDEWLYVFKPKVGSLLIYVKVILRANCIVVSFHEDDHETDLS